MARDRQPQKLLDLILDSKDGDWGKGEPFDKSIAYKVIRGTDFDDAYIGRFDDVPVRYITKSSAERRTLVENDILLETAGGTRDRSTGKSTLIRKETIEGSPLPLTCASFSRFIRIDPRKANPKYVFWHLQKMYKSGEMWVHQVQHTGVARFQYTKFAASTSLRLPDKATQNATSKILDALDERIRLDVQINHTLESMARALFKSWFIDFDPVRKKAEGKPTGLPPEIDNLFPDRFVESELGEIPEGWEITNVGALVEIHREVLSPFKSREQVFEHYSIPAFDDGEVPANEPGANIKSNKFVVKEGDLLVSRLNPEYKRVWMVVASEKARICSTEFIVCRAKCPRTSYFLLQLFKADDFYEGFQSKVTGTTGSHQRVSAEDLLDLKFAVPRPELLSLFDRLIEGTVRQQNCNKSENRALTHLRDSLLPKLLSGELEIPDPDRILEPAG